jgi:hypothetical protein
MWKLWLLRQGVQEIGSPDATAAMKSLEAKVQCAAVVQQMVN